MKGLDDATAELGSYFDQIHQCVMKAHSDYRSNTPLRAFFTERSHSSNINDLIWTNLKSTFEDEEAIDFIDNPGSQRRMLFGSDYVARVKKLDSRTLRPMNIITNQVMDFCWQTNQSQFPTMESPTNIDIGYTLTGPTQMNLHIYIRCPNGLKDYEWIYELEEPLAQLAPDPPTIQPLPIDPIPGADSKRVTLRTEQQSLDGEIIDEPGS